MTIKKKTVADAVSSATKASSKKAEPKAVVEVTDWDKVLLSTGEDSASTSTKDDREYEFYNGKDRLVRTTPGWGHAAGKLVKFVIYATDAEGTPLPELPPTRFGTLSDVEYTEKKYPISKGFYVNDNLCRNGRHKINVYRIHICGVVDKPMEVE